MSLFKGRAENNLIEAVEVSGGRLGATIILLPVQGISQGCTESTLLHLRVVDKLLAPALSAFIRQY